MSPYELDRSHFADPQFASANKPLFDDYIKLRVKGIDAYGAFTRAFGSNYQSSDVNKFTQGIEMNPYFITNFALVLEKTPFGDLWNPKLAVHEMLQLARNPFVKDNVRFTAAKELNIMCGIVIVDENGKTRAGSSLADFYNSLPNQGQPARPMPGAAEPANHKAPEPGVDVL